MRNSQFQSFAPALPVNRELHIGSDWLLVYRVDGARLAITLVRTGSHDDLLP